MQTNIGVVKSFRLCMCEDMPLGLWSVSDSDPEQGLLADPVEEESCLSPPLAYSAL